MSLTEREIDCATISCLQQRGLMDDEYTCGIHLWFHINYKAYLTDQQCTAFKKSPTQATTTKRVCTRISLPNVRVHYSDDHIFIECWIAHEGASPRKLVLEFADRYFFLKIAQHMFDWFLEDKANTMGPHRASTLEYLTAEQRVRTALANAER